MIKMNIYYILNKHLKETEKKYANNNNIKNITKLMILKRQIKQLEE